MKFIAVGILGDTWRTILKNFYSTESNRIQDILRNFLVSFKGLIFPFLQRERPEYFQGLSEPLL